MPWDIEVRRNISKRANPTKYEARDRASDKILRCLEKVWEKKEKSNTERYLTLFKEEANEISQCFYATMDRAYDRLERLQTIYDGQYEVQMKRNKRFS